MNSKANWDLNSGNGIVENIERFGNREIELIS